jgi:hypothetical protein
VPANDASISLEKTGRESFRSARANREKPLPNPFPDEPHWVRLFFYLQDRDFGRMFLRVCPNFPFTLAQRASV